MIRVLQVGKFYAPFVGGIERVVQDIAEGLQSEFDTTVLACSHDGPYAMDRIHGVSVHRAATPAVVLSMPLSLQFYSLFRRLARQADLIQFHLPFPLAELACLLDGCKGRKVVAFHHSDVVRQRALMPVYGPVLQAFFRRCDRILVASRQLKEGSPYLRAVQDRCSVLPYGIQIDEATRDVEPFSLPARDFILFVGRLVSYKGVDVLLRAMKAIASPLVIVGDGPRRRALESLARSEGVADRVHFVGFLPRPRLKHAYAQSRLLVLPSVMESEAFGLVQLEAMAHGKPVVNTRLPTGVPEVSLHDVSGLTVPPHDPAALAEAINRTLFESGLHARLSQGARARVREYPMTRFLDGVRRVYRDVLQEAPRGGPGIVKTAREH